MTVTTSRLALCIKLKATLDEQLIFLEFRQVIAELGWQGHMTRSVDAGCRHGSAGVMLEYLDGNDAARSFAVVAEDTEVRDAAIGHETFVHLHDCESYGWVTLVGYAPYLEILAVMLEDRAAAHHYISDPFPALDLDEYINSGIFA